MHFFIIAEDLANGWAKCMNSVKNPSRMPCQIPSRLAKDHDMFAKYSPNVCERLYKNIPPSVSRFVNLSKGPKIQREKPKLYKMEVVLFGKLKRSKEELKEAIMKYGGSLKTKLHSGTAAVISTEEDVAKMSKRMQLIKELGIHVVPEDFLDKLETGNTYDLLTSESICDWGTDV